MPQASSVPACHNDLTCNLRTLVDLHGRWSVILALFFVPKKRRYPVSDLSDHMRRDLGLTPDQRYW